MTSPRQGHTPDCGWPDDHMGACPEPPYALVRKWGSDRIHQAENPATAPAEAFGKPFTAVLLPAVMRCGTVLRGRLAVQMLPDAPLTCPSCKAVERAVGNASSEKS